MHKCSHTYLEISILFTPYQLQMYTPESELYLQHTSYHTGSIRQIILSFNNLEYMSYARSVRPCWYHDSSHILTTSPTYRLLDHHGNQGWCP